MFRLRKNYFSGCLHTNTHPLSYSSNRENSPPLVLVSSGFIRNADASPRNESRLQKMEYGSSIPSDTMVKNTNNTTANSGNKHEEMTSPQSKPICMTQLK